MPQTTRKETLPRRRGSTLPKSVQDQLDAVSMTPAYTEAELKEGQARIAAKLLDMRERQKAFRARRQVGLDH